MVKFWKEDFTYYKRMPAYDSNGHTQLDEFRYLFSVRGESGNYLMNYYQLDYPNIFVVIDSDGSMGTCGSFSNDKKHSDVIDLENEDLCILQTLLKPVMDIDKSNYEEYLCDSEYYYKDERWE